MGLPTTPDGRTRRGPGRPRGGPRLPDGGEGAAIDRLRLDLLLRLGPRAANSLHKLMRSGNEQIRLSASLGVLRHLQALLACDTARSGVLDALKVAIDVRRAQGEKGSTAAGKAGGDTPLNADGAVNRTPSLNLSEIQESAKACPAEDKENPESE